MVTGETSRVSSHTSEAATFLLGALALQKQDLGVQATICFCGTGESHTVPCPHRAIITVWGMGAQPYLSSHSSSIKSLRRMLASEWSWLCLRTELISVPLEEG